MELKQHIQRGLRAKRESKYVEFKDTVDFNLPHTWCEIIKDIIAMANSGGGVIIFGLNSKGGSTGSSTQAILELDPAAITDQIYKYTGIHLSSFEISEQKKGRSVLAAIAIDGEAIPIVFTKPGTYPLDERRQKTAFSQGTVYFRHGAKSEPGNTDDLRMAMDRRLDLIKKSWLTGVRKVVNAPSGSKIFAFPENTEIRETVSVDAQAITITDDPEAPAYRKLDYDITHPFRQGGVIEEINRALQGKGKINSYDIQCIKKVYSIDEKDNFCHIPKFSLSPQYSRSFVDWIINQYQQDNVFFDKTRKTYYEITHK